MSFSNNNWFDRHLHLELCRIAREWNLMFGMQMTFETACYPLSVTSSCYYLYKVLLHKHREELPVTLWFRIISWTFIFVGKVYIINYICEYVSVKVKNYMIYCIFNTKIYLI